MMHGCYTHYKDKHITLCVSVVYLRDQHDFGNFALDCESSESLLFSSDPREEYRVQPGK